MSENKENVRSFLHTQYKQDHNAALAARNINTIYGQDVVTARTSQNWFKKFREGRTSIERYILRIVIYVLRIWWKQI
jgi:hypothetical protein